MPELKYYNKAPTSSRFTNLILISGVVYFSDTLPSNSPILKLTFV